MTNIINLIALVFAVSAVLDAWFYGSIFSTWRAKLQAWRGGDGVKGFFGDLLTCSFCSAYHLPWLMGLLILPSFFWNNVLTTLLTLPIYSLAITKLVVMLRKKELSQLMP